MNRFIIYNGVEKYKYFHKNLFVKDKWKFAPSNCSGCDHFFSQQYR